MCIAFVFGAACAWGITSYVAGKNYQRVNSLLNSSKTRVELLETTNREQLSLIESIRGELTGARADYQQLEKSYQQQRDINLKLRETYTGATGGVKQIEERIDYSLRLCWQLMDYLGR
jgi:chromosome segregation ATPase